MIVAGQRRGIKIFTATPASAQAGRGSRSGVAWGFYLKNKPARTSTASAIHATQMNVRFVFALISGTGRAHIERNNGILTKGVGRTVNLVLEMRASLGVFVKITTANVASHIDWFPTRRAAVIVAEWRVHGQKTHTKQGTGGSCFTK